MMRATIGAAALAAGLLLAGAAQAAPGFATANVNLRAGPSTQYPPITVVPEGAPVDVLGCLRDRSWCDVAFAGTRGWVSNRYLELLRGRARAPVSVWGGPIVTFDVGRYWGSYYRDRPFYRERDRWTRFNRDYGWERPGWHGGGGPVWRDGGGPGWRDGGRDGDWRYRDGDRSDWRYRERERPEWRERARDDRQWGDGRGPRGTGGPALGGGGGPGPSSGTVQGQEVFPSPENNPLFPRPQLPPN